MECPPRRLLPIHNLRRLQRRCLVFRSSLRRAFAFVEGAESDSLSSPETAVGSWDLVNVEWVLGMLVEGESALIRSGI